jgi:hypothetical protein
VVPGVRRTRAAGPARHRAAAGRARARAARAAGAAGAVRVHGRRGLGPAAAEPGRAGPRPTSRPRWRLWHRCGSSPTSEKEAWRADVGGGVVPVLDGVLTLP